MTWVNNTTIASFIHIKHIDSYQKLHVLLFLSRHSELIATSQQLAEQLFLGDLSLLEKIINDLCTEGLVDCVADRYTLHYEPDTKLSLQCLTEAFEDPLGRQEILDLVTNSRFLHRSRQQARRHGTDFWSQGLPTSDGRRRKTIAPYSRRLS